MKALAGKWLRRCLYGLLALLLLILVLVTALVGTETGLGWVLEIAKKQTDQALSVKNFEGNLFSGFRLRGLRWQQQDTDVSVASLTLKCELPGLIASRLRCSRLALEEVTLRLPPAEAPATPEAPITFAPIELPGIVIPLDLQIDQLTIDALHLQRGDTRQTLRRVATNLSARDSKVSLSRFTAAWQQLSLTLDAEATLDNQYPLALEGNLKGTLQETRLDGHFRLQGDLDDLEIHLDSEAPAATDSDLTLTGLIAGQPAIQGEIKWRSLSIPMDAASLEIGSGNLELAGDLRVLQGRLKSSIRYRDWPEAYVEVDVTGKDLDLPDRRLTVSGQTVTREAFVVAASAEEDGQTITAPPLNLDFFATYQTDVVTVDRADLRVPGAEIHISGHLAEQSDLDVAADIRALAKLFPEAAGALQLQAKVRGSLQSPAISFDLQGQEVAYREIGIGKLEGEGTLDTEHWLDSSVRLVADQVRVAEERAEKIRLSLAGTTANKQLKLDINRAGESLLTLQATGAVIDDSWRGDIDKLLLSLPGGESWQAGEAAFLVSPRQLMVDNLCLGNGEQQICATGDWQEGELVADIAANRLNLEKVAATVTALTGTLPVDTLSGRLDVSASISRQDDIWSGNLDLDVASAVRARLHSGATIEGHPGTLDLQMTLDQKGLQGDLGGELRNISYRLGTDEDYWLLQVPRVRLSGSVDAEADATRKGNLRIQLDGLEYREIVAGKTELELTGNPGLIAAQFAEGETRVAINFPLFGEEGIEGELLLPGPAQLPDGPMTGELRLAIKDLTPFQHFAEPMVTNLGGRLRGTAEIGGEVTEPRITSRLVLENLSLRSPELGFVLDDSTVQLDIREDRTLALDGQLNSGGKSLTVSGEGELQPEAPQMLITIRGEEFPLLDNRQAKLVASPDLKLELTGTRMEVTGEVVIPRANIEIETLPESAVQVSPDLVIVGEEIQEDGSPGPELVADVTVRLGDAVNIKAFGLDADLTGALRTRLSPGSVPRGTGQIRVSRGTFKAYGQDLRIRRGVLSFVRSLDNPGIDLDAVRVVDQITVGVNVTGTVNNPRLSLFSDPPLSQSEALAYLVTGAPLTQASDEEQADISTAAAAAGGGLLANQLNDRLGLTNVKLITGGSGVNKTFGLGFRVSPNILVSYVASLLSTVTSQNGWRLEYKLNSKWSLEGFSGENSSGDISYRYETDKLFGKGKKKDKEQKDPDKEVETRD